MIFCLQRKIRIFFLFLNFSFHMRSELSVYSLHSNQVFVWVSEFNSYLISWENCIEEPFVLIMKTWNSLCRSGMDEKEKIETHLTNRFVFCLF